MTESTYPVLVVGGGSVGLLTADLLAHHGLEPVLVERRPGVSIHPRATGIGPRSVEILRELGLQDAVDAVAVDAAGAMPGKAVARTLAELTDDGFTGGAPPGPATPDELAAMPFRLRGICAQHRLDAVVADDLRRRGADLRWSTRLVSVSQDADGVDAVLDGPDGGYRLRCAHLVAADGTHSGIRDALGIGTHGPGDMGEEMANILFRADLSPYLHDHPFATCTITTPDAPGLLGTVDGHREWVFHVRTGGATFPPERCAALVRAAVGDPGLDVEVVSVLPWRPRALLADRFAAGRVFLVGDAAHTVSPLGAFGLNTGVADAHNLAWKLAAVHHGTAGPGLLDSYAVEREQVATTTQDQALRRATDHRLHWGRGAEADAARVAAGVWAAPIVHLGQRYASGAVVDPCPDLPSTTDLTAVLDGSPGSRLPHVWVDGVSVFDLVASRWTLLTGPAGAPSWSDAATRAGLATHVVDGLPDLTEDGALLVRPDTVVAWRATAPGPDPAGTLTDVLDRLLDRAADATPPTRPSVGTSSR